MEISGTITSPGQPHAKLAGTATASGVRSAISCMALTKLPTIGEGLVIPTDSRFIDLDGGEGEVKVPAGISLQPQDRQTFRALQPLDSAPGLNLARPSQFVAGGPLALPVGWMCRCYSGTTGLRCPMPASSF